MSLQLRPGRLEVEQINHVTVVKIPHRRILDSETIDWVGSQLLRLVEDLEDRQLVLNLGHVERVSSAMVGKLAALHERVRRLGGRLALCKIRPELSAILKTLQLHRHLNVYDQEQDAVQALDQLPVG
jgi:stage II sporulation protein AA (anti-sigma F factor antagonist)